MKRHNLFCTIALAAIIVLMGACNDTPFDDLSSSIQSFISQYYPEGAVESQNNDEGTVTVQMKNGATLVFDSDGSWTGVYGNGVPLPENFLFNELPPVLYRYLQETENTGEVYSVTRNWKEYVVDLLDTSVIYNIATQQITYQSASKEEFWTF